MQPNKSGNTPDEILIVSNDFPPTHGGIQRYMSAISTELAARDFSVTVIAPARPKAEEFDEGVPYEIVRYYGNNLIIQFFGMLVSIVRSQVLRRRRPLLTIASLWFPAGLAAMIVPRVFRGRLIVLVHGAELRPSRHGPRRRLLKFVLNRADAVIANSTFTASLIAACDIVRPVSVVHCGVDSAVISPRPSAHPLLLSVGRLVRRKGFDKLLEALPTVFEDMPDARCEIAGDGPLREALELQAKRLGIEGRVTFLGSVSNSDLEKAYERAWCFALPVRNDGDDVEGFGIVYLEAAMASLPSIGGVRSGAEDAIVDGETGLLIDGNDTAEIAKAVLMMLRNPARARAMGRVGRERATREFTWANSTDGILAS